jgi:hypothetical protein
MVSAVRQKTVYLSQSENRGKLKTHYTFRQVFERWKTKVTLNKV